MRPEIRTPGGARGFVLVGVVMLVLALTILGLSLFNLSSFESSFIGDSIDRSQAFHSALGGVERAKFALAVEPYLLAQAQSGLPEHVTSTMAWQERPGGEWDSLGIVEWDSNWPVRIRATAEVNGEQRTVEGVYEPQGFENLYDALINSASTDTVNIDHPDDLPGQTRYRTLRLSGLVRQVDGDVSWTSNVQQPPPPVEVRPVSPPSVGTFITQHQAAAVAPDITSGGGTTTIDFSNSTGDVKYFRSVSASGYSYLSADGGVDVTLEVDGPAVWLLDKGVRINGGVTVQSVGSQPNKVLVIVGGQNGEDEWNIRAGIWLSGGIHSPAVPVILVSDGAILVEQIQEYNHSLSAPYLSMYGLYTFLTGPRYEPPSPGLVTTMGHHPSMDDVIDYLASRGALPNTSVATATFKLVAGSWREVRP